MKRTVSIWAAILLVPVLAGAQGGAICLYADPNGVECGFDDSAPGPRKIYVLHTLATGVTSSQFSVPVPACMAGATWLEDTWVFPVTLGESPTGVSIGYGFCVAEPTHILTIDYFLSGTSLPDCGLPVLPHPARPFVEAADCDHEVIPATGGTSHVNSSLACQCEELPRPPYLDVSMDGLGFDEADTEREFDLRNIGGGELVWDVSVDVSWLTVSPGSGSGDATLFVTAIRQWLDPGTHLGTITIDSNGGRAELLVSIIVLGPPPPPPPPPGISIWVNPDSLYFGLEASQRKFMIRNYNTEGAIAWEARVSVPWITVAPANGYARENATEVNVYIDRTRLGPGDRHETRIVIGTYNADRLHLNPTIGIRVDGTQETTTASRSSTWGRVKALYRD